MRHLVVREHERIVPGSEPEQLDPRLYARLRAFDRKRLEPDRVFDWRDGYARAQQWVGVVQVPGLQVEILPKTDLAKDEEQVRSNLLYFLQLAGDVRFRSRDLAELKTPQAPLSETLARFFARQLQEELLRGPARSYEAHEENLRTLRGKLLVSRQVRHNAAHRERFYCQFDAFTEDSPLNRVLKAGCRWLLGLTRQAATQEALRHCLLLLDEVTDCTPRQALLEHVLFTRQNDRFQHLYDFCLLLLQGASPEVSVGDTRTYSLLFDMNELFERFIAGFLVERVAPRMEDVRVLPQAKGARKVFMREQTDAADLLQLKPDLLLKKGSAAVVFDTKWKRLDEGARRAGVASADLYQLFAYLHRYGCRRAVLLYPDVGGVRARTYDIFDHQDAATKTNVSVRLVNLKRDLRQESERKALEQELKGMVEEAFT